ncbi:MAG: hypothetical protein EHM61_26095 [Acidobacteria bacterium]|nr:MAG: hypothetical protein EHM61_26095 [Acidobacteriota bacterium]
MMDEKHNARGFSLIAVLLMTLLITSLCLYLCLLIANQSHLAGSLDSQLYCMVLAENGIEYARTLMPHLNLDQVLTGPDGKHSGSGTPEWRNPLSFDMAWRIDPDIWQASCDDGWPAYQGSLLLRGGFAASGDGRFYIRFSNNAGEPVADDEDRIVIVRSMGITRSRRTGLFDSTRNNVTLLEAVMRQETVFDVPAALALFGQEGDFRWDDKSFLFDGGDHPAVAGIGPASLLENLVLSLGPGQQARLRGAGSTPSLQDMTGAYLTSPVYRRVFDPRFWSHFMEQLPAFSEDRSPGLRFYPTGGQVGETFKGIMVAAGDFTLAGARIEGLLIHLGHGRLTLGEDTAITGAVWMSNNGSGANGDMVHYPLELTVLSSVSVVYNADAVRLSLTLLPPTQLGWRILFPEMKL